MWPEFTVRVLQDSPDQSWILALAAAVVGGMISLFTSLATTFGLEWWRRRGSVRQLAIAISAEVEATVRMLRFRGAIEGLKTCMAGAATGSTTLWSFKVGEDYLPVSRASMGNIGSLSGSVPYLLSELLTLARSAKLDLDDIRDPNGSLLHADAESIHGRYFQLVVILDHAIATADALVAEIGRRYRVPASRPWNTPPSGESATATKS